MELNQYGVDGVKAIMSAIEGKEHFEELYLGDAVDAVDDECASFIAYGIKSLNNLRVLKIDNWIGDEGAFLISQSFRFTPKFRKNNISIVCTTMETNE